MWGALVDYWHYTNDTTYNEITSQALVSQVGPDDDYMVPAHQKDEGNDDQSFWGFAVMSAAEKGYPAPPEGTPSWIQLVINLWNTQVARWDLTTCGGGLKWQIFTFNNGYDYKNSVSNGAFFQLAARLARYTGNQTYVDWAEKSWNWSTDIGLVSSTYDVYDGTDDTSNCTQLDHLQFSYSLGIYLYGAAVMYNYTNGSAVWEERTSGLLSAAATFFSPYDNATDIMFEAACETGETCDTDMQSFKAYLSRFMWATTQLAPYTTAAITSLLKTSASAAAKSCSGGTDGLTCGSKWYVGDWDGSYGVGQQMSALEIMQGLLINETRPPFTGADVPVVVSSTVSTATLLVATSTSTIGTLVSSSTSTQLSLSTSPSATALTIGSTSVATSHPASISTRTSGSTSTQLSSSTSASTTALTTRSTSMATSTSASISTKTSGSVSTASTAGTTTALTLSSSLVATQAPDLATSSSGPAAAAATKVSGGARKLQAEMMLCFMIMVMTSGSFVA